MQLRVLTIDDHVTAEIIRLVRYARRHPISVDELMAMQDNPDLAVGNRPEHVIVIPNGYRVVYSIEAQPQLGICEHVSVSVIPRKEGSYPSYIAVGTILHAFGWPEIKFQEELPPELRIWIEEEAQAINVLRQVEKS